MPNQHVLTQEGYEKLKKEYEELKGEKRQKAVERLQKARAMGDLSENSEYTSAREELSFVDTRIKEIEEILEKSQIVGKSPNKEVVDIGDTVEVQVDGKRESFTIVGELETDLAQKKLSYTSPIGKALLGKKKGDQVEILIPVGKVVYKILDIK